MIPKDQIRTTMRLETDADDISQRIKNATFRLKETDISKLSKDNQVCMEQELLADKNGKIFVPDVDNLRMEVLRLHHDIPIAGHPGAEKTLELIQRSYSWPGLSTLVKDYVSRCDRCARFKGQNIAPAGKLQPLPIPDGPWQDLSVDFTTDLPLCKGFDSILVVVDRFSKEVEFIPCNKAISALETAKLYMSYVWKQHGLPRTIISDRGPQFASQVMQDLCKRLGIQPKLSTAFHPQTDGQTERMNRDLQQYLRLFTSEKQDEWVDWLPLAQFSYNSKRQASTQKTPFSVTRTYNPRMGFEQHISKAPVAEQFTDKIIQTLNQTKANLLAAQERMKAQADKHRSAVPAYSISDKVWLSTEHLKLTRASKKLSEKWLGPYAITKLVGPNAVELHLPRSMRIHPVVNISRVKPYKERLDGQPTFRPGPVEVTEERDIEFEVDYIVDSRWKGRRLEFLVHWQGYSEEDRTWEPEPNLANAQKAIDEFHNAHPNAPRRLRMTSFDFYNLFKHCGKPIPEVTNNRLPFDRLDVD